MRRSSALLTAVAFLAPAAHAQGASFQGLGDLPGGSFLSQAVGVSADGNVVVGEGSRETGGAAFRWTASGGIAALPDLPGGSGGSIARAASTDGSVVVGAGSGANGTEAFRWTPAGGTQGLGDLPTGVFFSQGFGVSNEGAVVVGFSAVAVAFGGNNEAFRWTTSGGMVGLGDLPGGGFRSEAHGVSADGSVVVGTGLSDGGLEAFRWTQGGGMVGLGDLPGGDPESEAAAVSADGSVVVGTGETAAGLEAFRWTAGGGMVGLGDFPGGTSFSRALGVSANGSVVVGFSNGPNFNEAFVWTAAGGMQNLRDLLVSQGVDMTGWTLREGRAVSADGRVVVGWGLNPQGQIEAFRAALASAAVLTPPADTLLIVGDTLTIRYRFPGAARVNVHYTTSDPFDPQTAVLTLIAGDQINDGRFVWTVPDLLSLHVRLRVEDAADPSTRFVYGPRFRVRPLRLARVRPDSTYELFQPGRHGWALNNSSQAQLFPPEWRALDRFQYGGGLDPFTGAPYDAELFAGFPFFATSEAFADWPAWVQAFGTSAAYLGPGTYSPEEVGRWGRAFTPWIGSCYGMVATSLMAFASPDGFAAVFPTLGAVDRLFTAFGTTPVRDDVREAINNRYAYQDGRDVRARRIAAGGLTARQTLAELRAMLRRDDRLVDAIFLLFDRRGNSGAHAVLAYGIETTGAVGNLRVQVYDPNRPADTLSAVIIDSTADEWEYDRFDPAWGGTSGAFLADPIANYFFPALPTPARTDPPIAGRTTGGALLAVYATPGARVTLTDAAGRTSGYAGGALVNDIPGAVPDLPVVGGPTPPRGFLVPDAGPYRLALADAPGSVLRASFVRGAETLAYSRSDATTGQTDAIVFEPDGLLRIRNPDTATKLVGLTTLVGGDAEERMAGLDGLALAGPDSLRLRLEGGADLRLENPGPAKSYSLALRRARTDGTVRFFAPGVALGAGAIHRVRPDWPALGGPVQIDVDDDGDGTFDRTIEVANTVAAEPGAPAPATLVLHAPAPNPTAGSMTLRYDLPAAGRVRLALYDALGREVAVLVDGERPAGAFEAVLQAGWAPGVYIARILTESATAARVITVAR